jgi:hypothetical protein
MKSFSLRFAETIALLTFEPGKLLLLMMDRRLVLELEHRRLVLELEHRRLVLELDYRRLVLELEHRRLVLDLHPQNLDRCQLELQGRLWKEKITKKLFGASAKSFLPVA